MQMKKITHCWPWALSLLPLASAYAAEPQLPLMKEGLWESRSQQVIQGSKRELVSKICQSHEFEKSMKQAAEAMRQKNQCVQTVSQPAPNTYVSESRCSQGLLAGSVTRSTVVYQSDTSVHMENHTVKDHVETSSTIDSRYLGACPADMKPGDTVMADGTKINVGGH